MKAGKENIAATRTPGHEARIIEIITYLFFTGVALRGLYDHSDSPLQWVVAALLLAFLLLRVSEPGFHRRFGWYPYLYFALQACLVLALSLTPRYVDYFVVLFIPLSVDAMSSFSQRIAFVWIGLFILATAVVLTYAFGWLYTLPLFLFYVAAYLFFASYTIITRRAEEARAESQALLARLQATHRELQAYAAQVEELTAVQERNRLARELHDSVTQTIFSMTLVAESARILFERDPTKVIAQLDRLRELSKDALAEMRSLVSQLRPKTVAEDGLVPALRRHIAERGSQDGLIVGLHLEGYQEGERRLAPETEQALFRIAQEALNNVVKHAQTDRAEVTLCLGHESVVLQIADHGVGFDLSRTGQADVQSQALHLGLTSMRERAEVIGATFSVESRPGTGTGIRVDLRVQGP